jgi:hypothetical protein
MAGSLISVPFGVGVAALAGRRIDEAGARVVRFPLGRASAVSRDIAEILVRDATGLLICSAACGADLLALEVGFNLGIRCRIVLPYNAIDFRRTSVVDRPGGWGILYDKMIKDADARGDLVVLNGEVGDELAYRLANETIVRESVAAAGSKHAIAIVVWEGKARNPSDATASFRKLAAAAGLIERTVLTREVC